MQNSPLSRRAFLGGSLAGATALLGVSCGNSDDTSGDPDSDSDSGSGEVHYQFFATKELRDLDKVQAAINSALKAKGRNFTLKLEPMDAETFKARMPLALTAGNAGDVVFAGSFAIDFTSNATTGNYAALDELLNDHAPDLKASIPDALWRAAMIEGEIFGVVNQQLFPIAYGFIAQESIATKYGINPDEITTYADFDPILAEIKAGEPDLTVLHSDASGRGAPFASVGFGWDGTLQKYGLNWSAKDPAVQLFKLHETDEYRETAELAFKWHNAGYYAETPPPDADATSAWNAGQIAMRFTTPGRTVAATSPFPVVQKDLVPEPIITTGNTQATLSAISRTAEDAEAAIEWLEVLNTDREIYNLMCFGIEGEHYEFADESLEVVQYPEGVTADTSGWDPNTDWVFGNQFNAYYRTQADAESKRWEHEKALNDSALPSTGLGFVFNPDPVKTEVATVAAIVIERNTQNLLGLIDPATGVPDTIERLKAGGIEKIQTEAQRQIDAWLEKS